MTAPIVFQWDGEAMIPAPRARRLCDQQYVVGETYTLVVSEPRSQAAHNHYFASLKTAWDNLPEDIAHAFPDVEDLRAHALIQAGYCIADSIVCASEAEALRVAVFVKPKVPRSKIVVHAATVTVLTAKSQSTKAMDRATFQRSKQDVLDVVAAMVGVDAKELAA